jgi:sugar O-acyltransferase (sialic acid O-acetyltransferase NeuD family)
MMDNIEIARDHQGTQPTALARTLVIIGAGGLGSEYLWVAAAMNATPGGHAAAPLWDIVGFADDSLHKRASVVDDYRVHGTIEETAAQWTGAPISFAVAVGNNSMREQLVVRAEAAGWIPATLVHPSVIMARDVQIGDGTYIAPGCVLCPGARVGRHVIINTHVSVGHHSVLEDYAQICPGARVNGDCRVGKYGFLGSNASLTQGVAVGDAGVVGANSHAVRKVAAGATVIGCPAVTLRAVVRRPVSAGN